MKFTKTHGSILVSIAVTLPAIIYWANNGNQSIIDLITGWVFIMAVPFWFISLRRNQPSIIFIGTASLALIGSCAVIYYSIDAHVSSIAFVPPLAAVIQLMILGVIYVVTIKKTNES